MDMRQYLSYKGFHWDEVTRSRGKNAVMNCPFCGDTEKKFAIQLETGAFNCFHRNKCGVSGSFRQFQRMLGDLPISLDNDRAFLSKKDKVYSRPAVNLQKATANAANFLHDRKITEDSISKFKIGRTQDGRAVMLPYFKDGQLVNVKYRKIDEKKFWQEKDPEPVLFNRDCCSNGNALYIVEGECPLSIWN